ncbi:MAG: transposase [Myxococcales bacterium]|nr:transposase [Myxococcales bacterium]
MNLNVHFHTCFLDGVYVRDAAGLLEFLGAPPPNRDDLELVVRIVHRRALRWLERRGHLERPRSKRLRMRPPCHPRSKLARRSRRSEGRCARSHPMPLARQTVREKPWVSTRMLHPAKEAL